jgi:tryptophan synthase beta chain
VLHGNKNYLLQDDHGQIRPAHSIAAGLDYPGVGPEHCYLRDSKRVTYVSVNDREALNGFRTLSLTEGIIPALESAHALAYAMKLAPRLRAKDIVVINLSGRGDKDLHIVSDIMDVDHKV